MRIVITGATGFIGAPLVKRLLGEGHAVVVLSRDGAKAKATLGDVEAVTAVLETPGPWTQALAGADVIVHLAGESVASKRFDARQKQVIRDSRIESTRVIVEAIAALPADKRPKVLVSASGTDYYPFASLKNEFDDDEYTEKDPAGDSFLARVCRDWEKEAFAAQAHGVRVVAMRTGQVLAKHGGALAELMKPFKMMVGGKIGSGFQFAPWIHLDDAVGAYVAAITDERYTGPINMVAGSVRNAEFAKALGHAMGKPSFMPAPAFAVKMVAGEFAEYILNGRNVVPARLKELGFVFTRPTLQSALADVSS